jgi:nucleotide-binding universal stress UspA family protein
MFDRILLPLDRSALAECVLPHVIAIARVFESQVTLLHVIDTPCDGSAQLANPQSRSDRVFARSGLAPASCRLAG